MPTGRFTFGLLLLLGMLMVSTAGYTQTEVEITRPLDGSTVRETVRVLVPVYSVPEDGFISCVIDGTFRTAAATKADDGQSFIFRWDTKAPFDAPNLPADQRAVRDGRHTIMVRAYDASGKAIGEPKEITVYVSNSAGYPPAEGMKLRYNHGVGRSTHYAFDYSLSLKSISGATEVSATVGESIEGAKGVVKRSIETRMADNTSLVRQKLHGTLLAYQNGQTIPMFGLPTRSVYQIEETTGRMVGILRSTASGMEARIDVLNMPSQRVRIGDTWTSEQKVMRDVLSGRSVTILTTSTLEGLEWEGGHKCAKIRTTFSGIMPIPFSQIFTQPLSVTGEMTTYFGYEVGEVISSVMKATAKATVPQSVAGSLTQSLLPSGIGYSTPSTYDSYSSPMLPSPPDIGGPPGMEGMPPSYYGGPPASGTGYDGTGMPDTVDIDLEVIRKISLTG